MQTICTGEIIDPRGEPSTTDFLNQYNSQLQSKFPQVSVALTLIKEVCFRNKDHHKNSQWIKMQRTDFRVPNPN